MEKIKEFSQCNAHIIVKINELIDAIGELHTRTDYIVEKWATPKLVDLEHRLVECCQHVEKLENKLSGSTKKQGLLGDSNE
jgi:hypothetical protein